MKYQHTFEGTDPPNISTVLTKVVEHITLGPEASPVLPQCSSPVPRKRRSQLPDCQPSGACHPLGVPFVFVFVDLGTLWIEHRLANSRESWTRSQ